jgi:hypothetical protein
MALLRVLGQETPAGVPLAVGPTGAGLDAWPYISLVGHGQTLWQFDLRNRKLQTVSQIVTEVQLCDTYIEYIPEVTEHPRDYNMTTENEILDLRP